MGFLIPLYLQYQPTHVSAPVLLSSNRSQRTGTYSQFKLTPFVFHVPYFFLGESWQPKRMKAVRFSLINLPGRVVKRSRHFIIRLTKNHPSLELLVEARKKIAMLKPEPCGEKQPAVNRHNSTLWGDRYALNRLYRSFFHISKRK